jgi:hypothetical protein
MYVIDECHNYLHPNAFGQKLTPEHPLMQYATQHRKLKDTCYLVTQSVENVHVQVRRLGQQFNYIRNERKETFKGFRRGEGFRRTVYLVPPSSDAAVAIDSSAFRLDVAGLASCYFTAGGVGIGAMGTGDGGAKKRGLNLKWIYAFGLAALVMMAVFLYFGTDFATRKLIGETVGASVGKEVNKPQQTQQPREVKQAHPGAVAKQEPLIYTGIVTAGNGTHVLVSKQWLRVGLQRGTVLFLEDGRMVEPKTEDLRPKTNVIFEENRLYAGSCQ